MFLCAFYFLNKKLLSIENCENIFYGLLNDKKLYTQKFWSKDLVFKKKSVIEQYSMDTA